MMEAEDYTFAEMADIHFYGRANGSAPEGRRLCQETFPTPRLIYIYIYITEILSLCATPRPLYTN